jgi:putative oxygen-independent coproporphyrinogen III oxidase
VAVEGRALSSIFLGGGTPSLFSPAAIGRLLDHARARLGFVDAIEITLEANPGTIERGRFAEYRAAGVTRVSLGAQSFDARQLQRLGRIHSADETRVAAEELHAAGLANFNLDLMYALPGQTPADAENDLRIALALGPAHISQYHLTIEPGTVFAAAPPTQPADEIVDEMLERSLHLLVESGFEQYEVSGYARAGARCAHNLNYWTFGDYLGIGAGAHGKISDASRARIVRTQQTREPRRYLAADPGALARNPIAARHLLFEFAMNGFRLVEGFSGRLFESRTGLAVGVLDEALAPAVARGLVVHHGDNWRATPQGFRFLNDILVALLD